MCLVVLLLSQGDNFPKLIIAEEIPAACYYSNGCRRADILCRSRADPPLAGPGSQHRLFLWRSLLQAFLSSDIFHTPFLHSPQGWKHSFGTEVWGKGNLIYPASSHKSIIGKLAISSYLRKPSLGRFFLFFFPFCPPQMGSLGSCLDRN